jgi:SAM-dependent methyltransferase
MESDATRELWLDRFSQAFRSGVLNRVTLSKPTAASGDLKNVYVRPVSIAGKPLCSFTFRYNTRDETRNLPVDEAADLLRQLVPELMLNADLISPPEDLSLQYSRKRKPHIIKSASRHEAPEVRSHDIPKKRLLMVEGNPYLPSMGLATAGGALTAAGQRKFRQMDKYVEIVDGLLRKHPLPQSPRILDMGAGKGYLTFALYDYLVNYCGLKPQMTGLEIRPKLVADANALARRCGFTGLRFEAQDIHAYEITGVDMLIALHACDTLTDVAIAAGIQSGASIILVAPCCHKQVRRQMHTTARLQPLLKHGILEERQAELITDGVRALLLEGHGYQTRVFEFVSLEHTNKNVMIAAVKAKPRPEAFAEVKALKELFGVSTHYLEELLAGKATGQESGECGIHGNT